MNDNEAQALIDKIAGEKCARCDGKGLEPYRGNPGDYSQEPCALCKGTGYHPLAMILRVECDRHESYLHEAAFQNVSHCSGTRVVTVAQARERFYDLLVALKEEGYLYQRFCWMQKPSFLISHAQRRMVEIPMLKDPDPLIALLKAVSQVVVVEVPVA